MLLLSVDYGLSWPLSDIYWDNDQRPVWDELLGESLVSRLKDLAAFFTEHANEETGSFGSEENRKKFDKEFVALFNELDKKVGHLYKVKLDLWF